MNKNKKLTVTQEKVIELLLMSKSISEISTELKLSRTTIYEWKKDSIFEANFNIRKREIREKIDMELYRLTDSAVETIKNSLNSKNESVKLKTAVFLLNKFDSYKIGSENPDVIDRENYFSEL